MDFIPIFREISDKIGIIIRETPSGIIGTNPKGDITRDFDLKAEDCCFSILSKKLKGFELLGEEVGSRVKGKPEYFFVLDPCDGSHNRAHNIGVYTFSIAGLKYRENPNVQDVQFGFVKNLVSGEEYWAEKGKGMKYCGKPAKTSQESDFKKSTISADISAGNAHKVGKLLEKARYIRCLGTAAYGSALVSSGQVEAHVDVRGRLSIENFAATHLMVKEAGGIASDSDGKALNTPLDLKAQSEIVFSGNRKIHEQILELL